MIFLTDGRFILDASVMLRTPWEIYIFIAQMKNLCYQALISKVSDSGLVNMQTKPEAKLPILHLRGAPLYSVFSP